MLQFEELEKVVTVCLVSCLKQGPKCDTVSKLEMLNLLWFNIKEGLQRFKGIEMLVWIRHLRPIHPPWEVPENSFH